MTTLDWLTKLYPVAEGQAGYFTLDQAAQAGVDRSQISRQVAAGRLSRAAPGVYRLVHFPASQHEDMVIVWLQTGPNSVVSHDSALVLFDLTDALPANVHVTVPRSASHRRTAMRLHTNRLSPEETTRRNGMPVTTVARTIADVAATGLSEEMVIQAVQEAVSRGLVLPEEVLSAARSQRVRQLFRRALDSIASR